MNCLKVLVFIQIFAIGASAKDITVDIQKFDDVTHFEFEGAESWNISRQKDGKRFSFQVPKLEDASLIALKTLQSSYVEKINIEPGVNGQHSITVLLRDQDVQAFDYFTDQPSRLIIDLFRSEPKKSTKNAKNKKSQTTNKNSRKPASDFITVIGPSEDLNKKAMEKNFGIFDGADPDYSRFDIKDYEIKEEAVIASRRNLYIEFPILTIKKSYLKEIEEAKPTYAFEKLDTDEGKKILLLSTLFRNQRFVVFLKTLSIFREEYPRSLAHEQLDFMEADAYYAMWKKEQKLADFEFAMSKYKYLTFKYTNSALRERTLTLIAYALLDRNDYLGAYTEFQRFVRENPNSNFFQQVKMSMADSLILLGKYKDTLELLEQIEKDPKMGKYSIEAAYKIGDVHFRQREYQDAVKSYESAIAKHPEAESYFPNAFYNAAEAQFWTKNYKRSLDTYRSFIKKFPKNSHGGYAMTRVGELLEILGAPRERIIGALLESEFRYHGSPGSDVSNIRLLSYRIPEKTQKEIEDQIKTINAFIKTSDLPKLEDFKTILLSDGYYNKKDFSKSLDLLVDFYKQNPTSNNLDVFYRRIVKNIAEQISNRVNDTKYIDAIQTYGKYSASWLKNSDRLDLAYDIANSFENTGVFAEAINRYLQVLNRLYSIKGTNEEKERRVFEKLPSIDQINLRLASVYYSQGDYLKSQEYLTKIENVGSLNNKNKIERVTLSSLLNEKVNQIPSAIENLKSLVETWTAQPEEAAPVYLRLAKLYIKQNENTEAENTLNRILKIADDSKVVPEALVYQVLELKAELYLKLNRNQEAIVTYKSLLNSFEDRFPSAANRYKLGKIYFEQGNLTEAEKTWSVLERKPEAVLWHKLAQDQLSRSKWEDNYKKYVNRIPAMVDPKNKPTEEAPSEQK